MEKKHEQELSVLEVLRLHREFHLPRPVPADGQEKPTRLRASTLGAGFDPEDIKAVIAGESPLPELPEEPMVPPRRVNLIIDIQERMAQGKGPAYERWAKVYNLKQMAAALQYLQEYHLTDYAALTARTEAAVDHFHKLSDELRTTEEALSKTSELMAATVDYAKTVSYTHLIEHDPYVLLSLLCALHEGQWTIDEVQETLQMRCV